MQDAILSSSLNASISMTPGSSGIPFSIFRGAGLESKLQLQSSCRSPGRNFSEDSSRRNEESHSLCYPHASLGSYGRPLSKKCSSFSQALTQSPLWLYRESLTHTPTRILARKSTVFLLGAGGVRTPVWVPRPFFS